MDLFSTRSIVFDSSICRMARFMTLASVMWGRFRAGWHRLRGVQVFRKVTFGRRVRIDNPRNVSIGDRATLEDDVWLKLVTDTANVRVGEFSFIGRGTEIDVSEKVIIGDHVLIGPGVFITDHNHRFDCGSTIDSQGCWGEAIRIGDDVWLGARVVVLPGVTIGSGAVVGAGAVVTRSLPDNSISAGVPARILRYRSIPMDCKK